MRVAMLASAALLLAGCLVPPDVSCQPGGGVTCEAGLHCDTRTDLCVLNTPGSTSTGTGTATTSSSSSSSSRGSSSGSTSRGTSSTSTATSSTSTATSSTSTATSSTSTATSSTSTATGSSVVGSTSGTTGPTGSSGTPGTGTSGSTTGGTVSSSTTGAPPGCVFNATASSLSGLSSGGGSPLNRTPCGSGNVCQSGTCVACAAFTGAPLVVMPDSQTQLCLEFDGGHRNCAGSTVWPDVYPGQDGLTLNPYPLANRFLADANVVIDIETGLVWQRYSKAGPFDCSRLTLDGYTAFRLPTTSEVISLLDLEAITPFPEVFDGGGSAPLLVSATRLPSVGPRQLVAVSTMGFIDSSPPTSYRTQCVASNDCEGTLPAVDGGSRLVDGGGGVLFDPATGLSWTGLGQSASWSAGLTQCALDGGWRMGSYKELFTLSSDVRLTGGQAFIDDAVGHSGISGLSVQSSTPLPQSELIFGVNCSFGDTVTRAPGNSWTAFCVQGP
jgi:hypothetical protein